jgi:hypothetical protein
VHAELVDVVHDMGAEMCVALGACHVVAVSPDELVEAGHLRGPHGSGALSEFEVVVVLRHVVDGCRIRARCLNNLTDVRGVANVVDPLVVSGAARSGETSGSCQRREALLDVGVEGAEQVVDRGEDTTAPVVVCTSPSGVGGRGEAASKGLVSEECKGFAVDVERALPFVSARACRVAAAARRFGRGRRRVLRRRA